MLTFRSVLPLLPAAASLPIVALIDGGGWWIAIGAVRGRVPGDLH